MHIASSVCLCRYRVDTHVGVGVYVYTNVCVCVEGGCCVTWQLETDVFAQS